MDRPPVHGQTLEINEWACPRHSQLEQGSKDSNLKSTQHAFLRRILFQLGLATGQCACDGLAHEVVFDQCQRHTLQDLTETGL